MHTVRIRANTLSVLCAATLDHTPHRIYAEEGHRDAKEEEEEASMLDLASCHHPRLYMLCRRHPQLRPTACADEKGAKTSHTLHHRKREHMGEVGRWVGVTRKNEIGGNGFVFG